MSEIEKRFFADLGALEATFDWWWHMAPEDIESANDLLGLAEALLERTTNNRNLPLPVRRRICRSAFMIHEMCMCFDGSGMREKLPS